MILRPFLAASAALALAAGASAQPSAPAAAPPVDYKDGANWLCRPGRADACAADLAATRVDASGRLTRVAYKAAAAPKIDCFYVYPTVSNDPTPNSDMTAGPEERNVAAQQFARFGAVCRPFAPLYRQVTLTALRSAILGRDLHSDRELAYADVKAAWTDYLQRDNRGRGVVLIGHSQGSGLLTRLIKEEIDGKPVQARLVSAILAGTNLPVPQNADVGGAFKAVPLCRRPGQTGCAVAFASFRADSPPPANSRFGKVAGAGLAAACVNPAALGGGRADLHAYLPANGDGITSSTPTPEWVKGGPAIATPFVVLPGLLTGECVSDGGFSYLSVRVNAVPADPRTDTIAGDVVALGQVQKDWGLHLVDMNLTMGDLVELVGRQAAAYKR